MVCRPCLMQAASVRIDVDSWRNGGFDPNTGEPYNTATARVIAPVMFLGGSYEILKTNSRLA